MGQITDLLTRSLCPKMAIIIYHNVDEDRFYLESRPIDKGKMGAGVPLTQDCLSGIIETISTTQTNMIYGRIPECVLYSNPIVGKEKIVWYRKPQKKRLYFAKNLNLPDGEMWIPGILYMVESGTLSVYAFKGNKPKSKLYRAPFFNLYDNNRVCLGNAKVTKPTTITYDAVIDYWEEMFWKSEFTSILSGNPIKNNLATLTKKLLGSDNRFPIDELKPIKTKLEDLI